MSTIGQRNFSAGEIAPAIYSRVDQVKYQTGLKTLRNAYVMRHGGAASRPGTKFVCEVKSSSTGIVRLIPHLYNDLTTFIFELGNNYIRRIKDGAPLLMPPAYIATITGITTASQAVVTSAAHGYSNNREVYIYGVGGMTEINNRYFTVSDVTANTFKLKYKDGTYLSSSSYGAYTSGGSALLVDEVTSTIATADLREFRHASLGNFTVLTHPSYQQSVVALYSGSTTHPGLMTSPIGFAPGSTVSSPTNFTSASTFAGSKGHTWYLTAIDDVTGEESTPATFSKTNQLDPGPASSFVISFTAVSGCTYYRLYRKTEGPSDQIYGYLATVTSGEATAFADAGQWTIDPTQRPPSQPSVLSSSTNYAVCVGACQQRVFLGGTTSNPNRVFASRIGSPMLVTALFGSVSLQRSFPLIDSDGFFVDPLNRNFGAVKHVLDLDQPVVFTDTGEFILMGDEAGAVTPTAINPKSVSENGCSSVAPVVVGNSAIYVQAGGQILRDLLVEFDADGYKGRDLSVFSSHLVEGSATIVDMAYQKTPHSVVWMVRSDGVLLSLTYVKEQRILGWARHDFSGGTVENVCCIPEGTEHAVYVVVKRTINGRTTRYIERMDTRVVDDVTDYVGMDSAVTQDGTNTGSTTMTISGGSAWDDTELLTVTVSAVTDVNEGSGFKAADVGNAIHFYDSDGELLVRITITEVTSTTVVKGFASESVPAAIRTTATTYWGHAKTVVKGLWHLVGEEVSVFGDGTVVASPNNETYGTPLEVASDGTVTLPAPYVKVHVGLPFITDIETLNVDSAESETLANKKSNPSAITMHLEKTRGVFAGAQAPSDDDDDPLEKLTELKLRNLEGYNEPADLFTGEVTVNIQSNWNQKGRVFLRQVDPVPMTVNSIFPNGLFPFRKAGS